MLNQVILQPSGFQIMKNKVASGILELLLFQLNLVVLDKVSKFKRAAP